MDVSEQRRVFEGLRGMLQDITEGAANDEPEQQRPDYEPDNDLNEATDNVAHAAPENEIQPLTDILQWPESTDDTFTFINREDGSTDRRKIISTFEEISPFPGHPKFYLKGDIDSIYAANTNLNSLMKTFAKRSMWSIATTVLPVRKMWSSRFYLDTRGIINSPRVHFNKAQKLSLNLFPSVEIGEIAIPRLHRSFTLYLVNLATEAIMKDHMFNKTEIAVINSALNLARELSRVACESSDGLQHMTNDFRDSKPFRSYYGPICKQGAVWEYNEFQNKQTSVFAENFLKALKLISDNDTRYAFEKHNLHNVHSDLPFTPDREDMVHIASQLTKGSLFVLSLSGIKSFFNQEPFQRTVSKPANFTAQFKAQLLDHEEDLVDEANDFLLTKHHLDDLEDLVQLGVVPFAQARNGNRLPPGRKKLKLAHLHSGLESFERLFGKPWKERITQNYQKEVDSIADELHKFMFDVFGIEGHEPSETEIIFFDAGIEIRLAGDNSLLIETKKLHPMMMQLSKKKR